MPTSNEAQVEKKEGRNGREGGRLMDVGGESREGCVSVRVCVSEASAWLASRERWTDAWSAAGGDVDWY